jgi:hypothetical protein
MARVELDNAELGLMLDLLADFYARAVSNRAKDKIYELQVKLSDAVAGG